VGRVATAREGYRTAQVSGALTTCAALIALSLVFFLSRREASIRAAAAAEIHHQREWLRATLASIGDAVIATDADARVVFLNGVARALTGWGDDAVGRPLDE